MTINEGLKEYFLNKIVDVLKDNGFDGLGKLQRTHNKNNLVK